MSQTLKDFINSYLIQNQMEVLENAYSEKTVSYEDYQKLKELLENGNIFEPAEVG